jgi:transcriptional regulator with XRE-family HTH domain
VGQLRDQVAISTLAMNVRRYRDERNLSQEKLANLAGMEYSQVSRIERGLLNTSISVIFALARALEIAPASLIEIPETVEEVSKNTL